MSKLFKLFLVLFCALSLGFGPNNQTITAEVSKSEVQTGEVFTLTIKIEGEFNSAKLHLPELKDFKVISQNQSKGYSRQKEKTITSYNLVLFLFAPEPGEFTIDSAVMEIEKDKSYKTSPIKIKVEGKPLEEKKKILPYIEKGTNI